MISSFLLVPVLVPGLVSLLVSLLVSCFFAQKRSLFHHDFLLLAGSGSGSGACLPSCLPSYLFLLSAKKEFVPSWFPASCWFRLWFRGLSPFLSRFLSFLSLLKKGGCSIMISCFLLVPALVPGLVSLFVSLLVFSFFTQKRRLFHHDFLFLAGSGSGSGACLPSWLPSCLFFLYSKKEAVPSWFPASCWFRLWFRGLSPFLSRFLSFLSLFKKGGCSIMISCFLLVPALVPGLVSLFVSLFVFLKEERVPSWFPASCWFRLWFRGLSPFLSSFLSFSKQLLSWMGFSILARNGVCSIMICCPSWFRLGFRCLSPFFSLLSFLQNGVLFHHDFLVPGVSGSGAGACLPSSSFSFFSQEMVFCFLVPARVPVVVSLLLSSFFSSERVCSVSWFRLGFRCLSPFFSLLSFLRKGVPFHHDLLVAPGSGSGSGGCLPSYLFFLFSWNGVVFHHDFLVPSGSGFGSGACLPSFFCQEEGFVPFLFPGFSSFRLGFRCLCSFFSLLFIFSRKRSCSATIAWFRFYSGFLCSFFDFISDHWISKWAMNEGK